jgi:UDP:flavonoid glycosyltransferase YjiC (YdhE family)
VYASLGTVINDRPGFYRTLIDALRDADADLLVSCGRAFDPAQLGMLPDNVCVEQHVDQMEVLSRASLDKMAFMPSGLPASSDTSFCFTADG